MPHTTAPIGSLIGKMFGRSVRSTTMSACIPGSSEPVIPPNPATRAPSAWRSGSRRGCSSVGKAGLARQLAIEDGGVLQRDRRTHLREHVAGATRSSSTPRPGPHVAADQLLDRGRPETRRHLARRRHRHRSAGRREGIDIRVVEWESGERDVVTEEPRSAISEITPRSHPFGPAWAWMRRPAPGPRPSPSARLARRGDAIRMRCGSRVRPIVGERRCPARAPPGRPCLVAPRRSVNEHGAKAGVGVGLQRGVGEAVVRPPRRTSRRRW